MVDPGRVAAIRKWGPCRSLTEVKVFLGTVGVCRIFIQNFAHRASALIQLTRKDVPFEFGTKQIVAQEDLKNALINSPAIRAIDYTSAAPVILSVDTSYIAIGFFLSQCDPDNPRKRFYSRFGSITLNERESRFSQPKLELYGLYRALGALRFYIIGVRNLVVEVDARYIKGMLSNPDIAPSASVNRWIVSILSFHFTLIHVAGTHHGPDGLSRRPLQEGDDIVEDEDEFGDWIDQLHGFVHQVNPISSIPPFPNPTFALSSNINSPELLSYSDVPRSDTAKKEDRKLLQVEQWLDNLVRPPHLSDSEYATFVKYCTGFFIDSGKLWRKDSYGAHKIVAPAETRIGIIRAAHDNIGHKMVFATKSHVALRFWWPNLKADIAWYIRTCHYCQIQQTRHVLIPPTVATPAPIFSKAYVDTMHMPVSGGFRYIVQARCSLSYYPEFRMLRRETAKAIGDWIFEDIIC